MPVCKYRKTIVDATHRYKQKNGCLNSNSSRCLFFWIDSPHEDSWERIMNSESVCFLFFVIQIAFPFTRPDSLASNRASLKNDNVKQGKILDELHTPFQIVYPWVHWITDSQGETKHVNWKHLRGYNHLGFLKVMECRGWVLSLWSVVWVSVALGHLSVLFS